MCSGPSGSSPGSRKATAHGMGPVPYSQAAYAHESFKCCTGISYNAAFNILLSSQNLNAVVLSQVASLIWFMLICGKGIKIQWKCVCIPWEVCSITQSFATQVMIPRVIYMMESRDIINTEQKNHSILIWLIGVFFLIQISQQANSILFKQYTDI